MPAMNMAANCACARSLWGFARSITPARTAQARIRHGLHRLPFMALPGSACGTVSLPLPLPLVEARGLGGVVNKR